MAKQASVQEAVGTAGQSRVTAQLDELGWGVVSNPYHDLGTDLWLMAEKTDVSTWACWRGHRLRRVKPALTLQNISKSLNETHMGRLSDGGTANPYATTTSTTG